MNSEEKIAGSHITKFHTHKQKELVTTELLNKVSNAPGVACEHNIGQGRHNRSDTQFITSIDCKLATHKDKWFPSDAVKNGGITEIIGDTLNMVEGFINDVVLETSHMDAPIVVEYAVLFPWE